MDSDDQFLGQVLAGIDEAEVITIFFPLLRRALVVDTRHDDSTLHMVTVLPQVTSLEERIATIERLRPGLGKLQSILAVPWLKSVNALGDQGVIKRITSRLIDAEMPPFQANQELDKAMRDLRWVEHRSFVALVRGEGYQTLWASKA